MVTLTESWLQIMAGGGISAVVWLLGLVTKELKDLNSKIGEMLLRETKREARVDALEQTVERLPCVKVGYHCESVK